MHRWRLGSAVVCAWLLTGCGATVPGSAVKASEAADSDGAVVALLDTGSYPTAPYHPFGVAGSALDGGYFEGQRMAEYVTGPWQGNEKLRRLEPFHTMVVDEIGLDVSAAGVLESPMRDIAKAHDCIAGFSTARLTGESGPQEELTNVVLRFPDHAAATAAANEMVAKNPQVGDSPGKPISFLLHPETTALAYDIAEGGAVVQSFTAHGAYLLYQHATVRYKPADVTSQSWAETVVASILDRQTGLIERFVPTDPAKLADLPMDPTGQLVARTLWAPDGHQPAFTGAWQPNAALHFEDDPLKSAVLFSAAGVEVVSQRLARVYQAHKPDGAARIVAQFAADTAAMPGVQPASVVRGLPGAKCFVRPQVLAPTTDPPTLRQFNWHVRCIAKADRYAFITYSDDQTDAQQQAAAQYRILAGK